MIYSGHTTSKWMEIKEGDFTSIKNRMSLVISLYRCGIWTLEERAGLLEKIADGSIDALPESAYARFWDLLICLIKKN